MVGIQIGEHHDRKTVVRIAGNSAGKALPGSAVLDALVVVLLADHPAKSITSGIWLTVIEWIHGPNAVQAGLLEQLRAIQRGVGGRVERGRDPLWIFELAVVQFVAGGAIGNDVALVDEPRGSHA